MIGPQINKNGVPTKLIPSLDGGLYQFDGDGLEPVPLAADMMLSSSFRFNDNTMVVGGKEKETFGIDLSTGQASEEIDQAKLKQSFSCKSVLTMFELSLSLYTMFSITSLIFYSCRLF